MRSKKLLSVFVLLLAIGSLGAEEQEEGLLRERLQGWLRSWAEQQGDSSRPALVLHPRYGLGNRIMTVVSGVMLALATDRRLYIEWGENFDNLFEAPFLWNPANANLSPQDTPDSLVLDLTAASEDLLDISNLLACEKLSVLEPDPVIHLVSDQYFQPLLWLNPHVLHTFRIRTGLNVEGLLPECFSVIGTWILRPTDRIEKAADVFEESRSRRGCDVGVHIRVPMYDWEDSQVPHIDPEVALKCARNLLLPQSDQALGNCSSSASEAQSCQNSSAKGYVFVATTAESVKTRASSLFGKRAAFTRGPVERMEDGAAEEQALMDLVLLSRCKKLVTSVHSTFSYAAHALSGLKPYVVTSASSQDEGWMKASGTSRCKEAESSAPCFHAMTKVKGRLKCTEKLGPAGKKLLASLLEQACWH